MSLLLKEPFGIKGDFKSNDTDNKDDTMALAFNPLQASNRTSAASSSRANALGIHSGAIRQASNSRLYQPQIAAAFNPLQNPTNSQRLIQMQALPENDPEIKPIVLDEKNMEIMDCDHLGNFITEDGYPVDIYIDKALSDKDFSKFDSIFDLKYSLNHNDKNGHRTLHISDHHLVNESFYANVMRDTIYGHWTVENGKPVLDLAMHVNDNPEGKGPSWESAAKNSDLIPGALSTELAKIGGEMRKKIFKDHVQDSLQAMAIGVKTLLDHHPELKLAKTQLRFLSELEDIAETVDSGTIESHLDKPVLDKKSPMAQLATNVEIWSDAASSSTKAMRQLMDAILKPDTLGPLLKNPKTTIPTLALLVALGVFAAHNRSNSN